MENSHDTKEVHLREYLKVLGTRKWTIIVFTAILVGLAILYVLVTSPVYSAKALVVLEPMPISPLTVPSDFIYATGRDIVSQKQFVQTQFALLQSRTMARAVMEKLDLFEKFTSGTASVPLVGGLLKAFGTTDPIERFITGIGIDQPNILSKELELSYTSEDPELATQILTALLEEYKVMSLRWRDQHFQENLDFLKDKMEEFKSELKVSQEKIEAFKEENDIVGIAGGQSLVMQKFAGLNITLVELELARMRVEVQYEQVKDLAEAARADADIPIDLYPSILINNPAIAQFRGQLILLETEQRKLKERYGDMHPRMVELDTQLREIRTQIKKEVDSAIKNIEASYELAKKQEQTLIDTLAGVKKEVTEIGKKQIDFILMTEDTKINQFLYTTLITKFQETEILSSIRSSLTVQVIDPVEVPTDTSGYRKFYIPISIPVGLIIGILLAFIRDYFDEDPRPGTDD